MVGCSASKPELDCDDRVPNVSKGVDKNEQLTLYKRYNVVADNHTILVDNQPCHCCG